jgi:hypothetical protein
MARALTVAVWLLTCTTLLGGVPALTVCEALNQVPSLRNRDVIVVGHSAWTFEGVFLAQRCHASEKTRTSLISLGGIALEDAPGKLKTFNWPTRLLQGAVSRAQKVEMQFRENEQAGDEPWVAIYGRLVAPKTYRAPQKRAHYRIIPGNGYGANGSVMAKLVEKAATSVLPQEH